MARTVVVEHTQEGVGVHFDWMIERPDVDSEHRLDTWRTASRPDLGSAFAGERIGLHRAAYLTYEGEISGGRGWVRRVASGDAVWVRDHQSVIDVRIRWSDGRVRRYEGRPDERLTWHFGVVRD